MIAGYWWLFWVFGDDIYCFQMSNATIPKVMLMTKQNVDKIWQFWSILTEQTAADNWKKLVLTQVLQEEKIALEFLSRKLNKINRLEETV